jgi:hypothetical protein
MLKKEKAFGKDEGPFWSIEEGADGWVYDFQRPGAGKAKGQQG